MLPSTRKRFSFTLSFYLRLGYTMRSLSVHSESHKIVGWICRMEFGHFVFSIHGVRRNSNGSRSNSMRSYARLAGFSCSIIMLQKKLPKNIPFSNRLTLSRRTQPNASAICSFLLSFWARHMTAFGVAARFCANKPATLTEFVTISGRIVTNNVHDVRGALCQKTSPTNETQKVKWKRFSNFVKYVCCSSCFQRNFYLVLFFDSINAFHPVRMSTVRSVPLPPTTALRFSFAGISSRKTFNSIILY